ncbi:MAG: NACHT domain-containing protein [Leptolyngbyaceae cyanobacterium MO_188.B28]|nr:NACHT domain-containing protein [Leptolyngbyaceae cyanobacterium MO_188.B28]
MFPQMALLETIGLEAVKKLAGLILTTAWGMGDANIDKPLKQAIFNASKQYIKNYRDRHGILKVLGMAKPVSLESVYTTAQLLDASALKHFETIEGLQELFREGNKRRFQRHDTSRRPGVELTNTERYLMVLGGPGVGKSTFLRKMGLEALKGNQGDLQHQCIPVFLELKRFDGDEINIRQLLIDEFQTNGFPEPERFTDNALKKGRLLILLDGLDEVLTQNLTQVIRQIQDFVDQYSKNRFIASCRIAAYHGYFKRFTDVVIADFDDAQIEQFIHNWFPSELDQQTNTAEKCWELLQRPENQAAKELAQTPLLFRSVYSFAGGL